MKKVLTAILSCVLAIVALSGCTGIDAPYNPEPVVTMAEATGITRTEAVISARIENPAQGRLDYVRLFYGQQPDMDDRTEVACDPDASVIALHLENLKPGTSYACYVVAGTSTATIKSNTISFTTLPNDRPSIAPPAVLSTGPVGIIVGIEITDDGGEPVTQAGCDVTDIATAESVRFSIGEEAISTGFYKLHISGLAARKRYAITPFAANTVGTTVGETIEYTTGNSVMLAAPGELSVLLGQTAGQLPEPLVIAGMMDGDDFRFLRALLGAPSDSDCSVKIRDIDLTDVTISEGGGSYDGSRFTVADVLTTGIFADCVNLRSVRLPSTAVRLERDAVARCTALETLMIPAAISQLLPSSGCTALYSIEVSPANGDFTSVDGVLFDRDVSDILWFPVAKDGEYILPPTVTAISEEAFAGTSITALIIPPSVNRISRGAFARSSLTEITLPDNLSIITAGMFQNCAQLTSVHLGSGTELIGDYVFDGTALTDLYVAAVIPPVVSTYAFVNKSSSVTAGCMLHVPDASKAIYRNHPHWGKFYKIEGF